MVSHLPRTVKALITLGIRWSPIPLTLPPTQPPAPKSGGGGGVGVGATYSVFMVPTAKLQPLLFGNGQLLDLQCPKFTAPSFHGSPRAYQFVLSHLVLLEYTLKSH